MAIQNINIQIQPHQPARASDFNTVSGKVRELVDAYNALGATIHAVTDADALHDKSQIGTYVLLPVLSSRYFSGLLSVSYVPFASSTRITQTLLSSTTPQYDDDGNLQAWLPEPCTMIRYYDGRSWSPWVRAGGDDIKVDDALSAESENPIQNKAVTAEFANHQSQIDNTVTATQAISQQVADMRQHGVVSAGGLAIVILEQAEYDAMLATGTLDTENTLYGTYEAEEPEVWTFGQSFPIRFS